MNGNRVLSILVGVFLAMIAYIWNDMRLEVKDMKAELKEIARLAAERGPIMTQIIPDHERRIRALEDRRK